MIRKLCLSIFLLLASGLAIGQARGHGPFTYADSLRGNITPERAWWDVQRYDLTIAPNYLDKSTKGHNVIVYKVVRDNANTKMQLDLQPPLQIDHALLDDRTSIAISHNPKDANVWYLDIPQQKLGSEHTINVYFSGSPHIAVRPPWDGGWTFTKDSLGRPWMTVCCQGLGASIWYPCKDHQSDEPDKGATLTMIVPDTLVGVANGRLLNVKQMSNGLKAYTWGVVNPISTYCLIPYIGKYVEIKDRFDGSKGKLDMRFWALDYHEELAKNYFHDQATKVLKAHEYWFGPYPFYEDSYKLVETDNTGMEHQSNVGYGNHYAFGYRGRDDSHTGYGLRSDFIILHESAHEWWGNSLTSYDLADMWVHESFANYAEALYAEYFWGKKAGNDYVYGVRSGIQNKGTIIPAFNVNAEGTGDMYPKGGNMLHSVRHSMDNDGLFRSILHGLQKDYYHKIVTGKEVVDYFSKKSGFDYTKVFEQYLTTVQVPVLKIYFEGEEVHFKYDNCIAGFNLPIVMDDAHTKVVLKPTSQWKTMKISTAQKALLTPDKINYMYYINVSNTKD